MAAITDQKIWNSYWKSGGTHQINTLNLSNRAVLSRLNTSLQSAESIIEVGCAPGAWLRYMAEEFNLQISGIDYSEVGVQLTRENLSQAQLDVELLQLDFMEDALPKERWDVAYSMGFIEHFTDLDEVIARHARLVKPGGKVIVFAPNLKSAVGRAKGIIDAKNMALHVLVDKPGLSNAAIRCGLEIEWCDYLGPLNLFFIHMPQLLLKPPTRWALWGLNQMLGSATYRGSTSFTSSMVGLVARKPK